MDTSLPLMRTRSPSAPRSLLVRRSAASASAVPSFTPGSAAADDRGMAAAGRRRATAPSRAAGMSAGRATVTARQVAILQINYVTGC